MDYLNFNIPIKVLCKSIPNPRPWKYEAIMKVMGKERFLTYGDTIGEVKKQGLKRLRVLLLKTKMPD